MGIRIPPFPNVPGLTDTLVRALDERDRLIATKLAKDRANHSVLLQSPAGKVYEITVDDAGVLVSTLVADV